jgi:monoamine oxidase
VERGGQLIDQGHTAIGLLGGRLGLQTDNLLQAEPNGSEPLYHFDGQPYTYGQATSDLRAIYQNLHADLSAAGYPTVYSAFTPRGQELDRMSILDWFDQSVPGGARSRLGQLLEVAYTIEYGADAGQQSALNLLYLLGFSGQGQLRIFGPSNEKYAIWGGCDQLPARLADQLPGQIELGNQLVALRQGSVTPGPRGRTRSGRWASTPASPRGRGGTRGQRSLRRGAHLGRRPGLAQRRGRDRPASRQRAPLDLTFEYATAPR